MTDFGPMVEFMRDMGTPDLSHSHVSTNIGWEMAVCCSDVDLQLLIARLKAEGCMFSITVDTSEARGGVDYLDIEVSL